MDLLKHSDNLYTVHLNYQTENEFALGSGYISMALKIGDDFPTPLCEIAYGQV